MPLNQSVRLLGGVAGFMLLVFVANLFSAGWLNQFGIHPRQWSSLWTLLSAPFLHANLPHLLSNLTSFLVLGFLCGLRGRGFFLQSSLIIILLGGFLVWLAGRQANHIGASGWIFGLWALLLATAWFERSFTSIVVAIVVVALYGGMVFGVLPVQRFVSFESHLFGAVAGILAAYLWRRGVRLF
jgi:membrane associated rhomboid family serine protease